MQENSPDPALWDKVVRMIQVAFCRGHLEEKYTWKTVVLTPKGNGDSRGIGFVEVLWKTVTGILNCCLMSAIQFQNKLRGYQAGRGTRTASLESKPLQQLMETMKEVLYEIFLDMNKAYDTLDHDL